ncbi:hypothetical protein COCMIDRAFT_81685 [Bipolaris oryzae ATCC 44560]|uniref:Uncharacterized protein n=1 Tax=Bipolaris oryzae ATCC 44560 TaxID=930090 RepID=W6ZSR6_COCMI|nr:uncharacterized protein COCMIDRAFT_81685 [Bipolaris oryzae ATCC 44560]EUC50564.1 hypothetical protein COCMIDRAFT_81685 [Bipolaris oryzae ATCC 44560]
MCSYNKINFRCGHFEYRIAVYCHFARNDPNHQCFGAWTVKRAWDEPREVCRKCARR